MADLLLASQNPGKLNEMRLLVVGLPFRVVGPRDLGIHEAPDEYGETFLENATIKDLAYARLSGHMSVADDSGLSVDALGGEPISGASAKLGPYSDANATHQFQQSKFHRSRDFCGTCHDVSNAAVGDLAHNKGTQATGDQVTASGVPGGPVDRKAAFNNFHLPVRRRRAAPSASTWRAASTRCRCRATRRSPPSSRAAPRCACRATTSASR